MSLFTYNVELSSKPDKSGRWSVMIRLHLKGHRPGRVLTSVKLSQADRHWASLDKKRDRPADWGKWVIRHPDKDALNSDILLEHSRIKRQVEAWERAEPDGQLTPAVAAERFRSPPDAVTYYQRMLPILEECKEQAYRTWSGKQTALNAFVAFAGAELPVSGVTPQLVRQFQQYLSKRRIERTGQKMKGLTVNCYLDKLHGLHKQLLIASGVSPKQAELQSPWNDRERVDETKVTKLRLNESTIERVSMLDVDTTRRVMTPVLSFRLWMLAHWLAGARHSDVLQLRYQNFTVDANGQPVHVNYEMMKTGFRVSIPVFAQTRELLSIWWKPEQHKPTDYVLPFLSNSEPYAKLLTHEQYKNAPFGVRKRLAEMLTFRGRQVNLCLKEIQQAAGLPDVLSMHTSRHSFADMARRIMQSDKSITLYDIQLMLGHGRYETTVGYMEELSGQDATAPMMAVFDRKKPTSTE